MLNKRAKWFSSPESHLKTGDLVCMIEDKSPRGQNPLARVKSLNYGNDGLARSAVFRSATGEYPFSLFWGRSMLARLSLRSFYIAPFI